MSSYYGGSSLVNIELSETMNKFIGKFGHECFGFRSLISPKYPFQRISTSSVSTSKENWRQDELLKYPIPTLTQTLDTFLYTAKPHLNDAELVNSKKIIEKFKSGVGAKLQGLLEERAKKMDNWLADWWLHSAYLDFRWPVVIFSNPGLVFPFQTFESEDDQLRYTAKLVTSALNYKQLVDSNSIPLDKMGKQPLDMGQYKKVYGTCRIPGLKRDLLSYNNSDYIIVMHNGHIFTCPLWGEDNAQLSEDQIISQLKSVIAASSSSVSHPIGILTSEHRDTWGKVYQDLIRDGINKAHLQTIEKSLFIVCLDKGSGGLDKQKWERQTIAARQTIHGGGSTHNTGNRWFDKTIQFVVGKDGINGLTYEHSPAEGQPIAVLADHIIDYITANKVSSSSSKSVKKIDRLDFNISSETKAAIDAAKTNIDKLADDLDLNCFTFNAFGKDFIKSQKLSPDSFIQMAMQFAFYRLHNSPAAHYESASLRKYVGGRTETIRSCSVESVNFAKVMLNTQSTIKEKVDALKKAINSHKDYTVMALDGFGVDRHLLGLKLIAIENEIDTPELFSDAAFVRSSHMRLTSSQVASRCDGFMCYAPSVTDGYATCYNPRNSDMNFATSAFKSNSETDIKKYRQALEDSLMDMHNTLLQATQSKL